MKAVDDALAPLAEALARDSARAAQKLGVDFHVDDPRVARWLMLTMLEALLAPGARSTPEELLRQAADGLDGASAADKTAQKTARRADRPLISWPDLIAVASTTG